MYITIEINADREWCGKCRYRDIRHGYCKLFDKYLCEPKKPKRLPNCLSAREGYLKIIWERWTKGDNNANY